MNIFFFNFPRTYNSHLHVHKWVLLVNHINDIFVIRRVITVIVYVFITLLNSMVHLTDLDYIFVFFGCNG